MSLESIFINVTWKKNDAKRDAGLTIPEEVRYIRDNRYGDDEFYNSLDICYPRDKADKKLPVIISIHGGAYVYGSKEVYQFYCADLARRGFTVVNFDYRLAPKFKFPSPLEDISKVIEWLETKKELYPVDMSNVFLIGDSAGAQLASQYGAIYSNEKYRKLFRLRKPEASIRGLSLACGLYDLEKHLGGKRTGLIKDYFTSSPEGFGEKLKVLDYIDQNYPPCYIFSSGGDFLLENVEPMTQLLRDRGVECESKVYGDKNIGHVFHVDVKSGLAGQANDDQCDFMKRHVVKAR